MIIEKNTLIRCKLLLLLLCTLSTCQPKKLVNCRDISLKKVYGNRMGNGKTLSYEHFLLLTGYQDECFAAVRFSELARKYADTCSQEKPIEIITFLYSTEGIDFESNEADLAEAKKYELMSFMMNSTSIKKIYFIRNGVRKTIELENCNFKETLYE